MGISLVHRRVPAKHSPPHQPPHTARLPAPHLHLLSWFLNAPAVPFGVHHMALAGKAQGKDVGMWIAPSAASGAVRTLVESFPACGLGVPRGICSVALACHARCAASCPGTLALVVARARATILGLFRLHLHLVPCISLHLHPNPNLFNGGRRGEGGKHPHPRETPTTLSPPAHTSTRARLAMVMAERWQGTGCVARSIAWHPTHLRPAPSALTYAFARRVVSRSAFGNLSAAAAALHGADSEFDACSRFTSAVADSASKSYAPSRNMFGAGDAKGAAPLLAMDALAGADRGGQNGSGDQGEQRAAPLADALLAPHLVGAELVSVVPGTHEAGRGRRSFQGI
ncbi:hypothetical protein B0H11DRAFT_2266316 [Mycena galericulata]|nr:hypothetical protein B0H11DRAFT_2266316 [Mycena galericulata]